MIRLGLFGSEGRMGRLIREHAGDEFTVVARYDCVAPGLGASIPLPLDIDVLMDFSSHAAWSVLDRLIEGSDVGLVSGTTGLEANERDGMLEKWSRDRAVFYSANMSRGVFVLGRLVAEASKMLGPAGDGGEFDVEIIETHHRGKADSPSGTARLLLESWEGEGAAAAGHVHGREGPDSLRSNGEIGVHSVRGGDVVGEHRLLLLGDGERLELTHSATSRSTFALGALAAARFVAGRKKGLYGMADLLGASGGAVAGGER